MDIDEILGKAKLPETSVTLCLAADLQAQWDELDHQLSTASNVTLSLGEISEAKTIAAQMEALRAQMAESEVVFRLRALDAKAWSKMRGEAPKEGESADEKASYDSRFHAWVCKILAASCVEPAITATQADQLSDKLSEGQWLQLSDAAYDLNAGRRNVPFSAAASALTRSYEQNSKRQEPGGSPTADGSAASRDKKRSTSTSKAS